MTLQDPTDVLQDALDADGGPFVELRYHKKYSRSVAVEKGRVDSAKVNESTGVGVRVLEDGTWGFASTDQLDSTAVRRAVERARSAARATSALRKEKVSELPRVDLAQGRFEEPGYDELRSGNIEERLELAIEMEANARGASNKVTSASCGYAEMFEEKGIVTSDGAKAWTRLVRPEFRMVAVAQDGGEIQRGAKSVGVTGAWDCLFRSDSASSMADEAAKLAVDLLVAPYTEGGRKHVILSPSIVGLLTHEAIGHTVEADLVAAGSCAKGKIGERVASDLVTLCDSGASEYHPGAGGTLSVDDEGVRTERTVIIENGMLRSFLHDRESAAAHGVSPTGNARAWEYDDEPMIRMRNTYIEPGSQSIEEIIASTQDGLILDGPKNGQADSNGEFMFGTMQAWPVKNGKRGELMRGVNISGIAFEALGTVDAVSSDFQWDLGSGHCGKGQLAKVDAGGPWLRLECLVGGRNE